MTYKLLKEFKRKYPMTIAWRIKAHAKVIDMHINPDETLEYAFVGQKGEFYKDLFHTFAIAITDKRIIIAQKRVLFGYIYVSITPDLFNDLTIDSGIMWGKVTIDTLSEKVCITNIDIKALPEIETAVSSNMMLAKQKYQNNDIQAS